jgi:glycine cleavage system H protein
MGVPSDCRYTKDHEWARKEGELIVVGITDYAQDQLGDVVFLELPNIGTEVKKGDSMAVVESVKAASDIYAPISGKVVERNENPVNAPDLINKDPFKGAWLVKLSPTTGGEFESLMVAGDYDKLIDSLTK